MSRLSVLNKASRNKAADTLLSRLKTWSASLFIETPEISISFNDDFFSSTLVSQNDAVFSLENGFLMIENYAEISSQLIYKSLAIEGQEVVKEDEGFWHDLNKVFNHGLLDALLGQKTLTDKIIPSTNHQEIKSVFCITLQFAHSTMSIFADMQLAMLIGLYVPSQTSRSKPLLTSRELAVGNEKVTLQVKLQAVSLQLQELLELKVGDLIKLEHALEQPLLLETQDSTVPVKTFLVKKENKKALLLSK